ncbi:hypothetical protein EP47_08160 [Legionella norrlandica]|uniref:Uncharacterized protein n=1 Tax=Legionella norrlandica TaxID=1498499 RepID=A0A0A2STL6_9GAMM|nr:ankyrin repeat domain-containing protein [Legionella norrlandica]KGP64107.1 hypothetical protein EP47_08160 [Legionella norrlandica]
MQLEKKEHSAHPIFHKIPWKVWHHAFYTIESSIRYYHVFLRYKDPTRPLQRYEDPLQALLSIIYFHPELNDATLLELARKLGIKPETIYQAAIITGKRSFFDNVVDTRKPDILQRIRSGYFFDFLNAAKFGHLEIINGLVNLVPDRVHEIVAAYNFAPLREAATYGYMDIVNRLVELVPDQVAEMAVAGEYAAFRFAASHGHLDVLDRLIELAPHKVPEMIASFNFSAFCCAAKGGYLNVLNRLIELAPDKIREMITAENFHAFRYAAANGHLHIINRLIELAPDLVPDMLASDYFFAFHYAAMGGYLDVMNRLLELAPEKTDDMISALSYSAFRWAARYGHLDLVNRLVALAPNKVDKMVAADDFFAFKHAAQQGHLHIINRLIELAPDQVINMIIADRFHACHDAIAWGHIPVLIRLMELAPNEIAGWIDNNRDLVLTRASNHESMLYHMLNIPENFAYAELHEQCFWYDKIMPFINTYLEKWHNEQRELEQQSPNQLFNLDNPQEASLGFYMVRHLIRCNDISLSDEIHFLLDIPAIRHLAHQEMTPNRPNELLRLSLSVGNEDAANILLTIPAVYELAQTQQFYSEEQQAGMDLRALATDRESSMNTLTQGEQKRLAEVIKRYRPVLKKQGVAKLAGELRQQLIEIYEKAPATIQINNQTISLPLTWIDFNAMSLTPEERQQALQAYYQHKTHTAFRYLSKPNFWMAKNANHVQVNLDNTNERWSTFEEYLPLIAMFWLAATDKDTPPCDDHTFESRLAHFIEELAFIGRAHNWDKHRIKTDTHEQALCHIDRPQKGNLITEEYDDLEGDKPSCFSGVKRRLFQSVLGHPLLKVLTLDGVQEELRNFLRDEFRQRIPNESERALLKQYLDGYIVNLELSDTEKQAFQIFNIRPEQANQFIENLANKYGSQLTKAFRTHLEKQLALNPAGGSLLDELHFFRFGEWVNDILLPQSQAKMSPLAQVGFFSGTEPSGRQLIHSDSMSPPCA